MRLLFLRIFIGLWMVPMVWSLVWVLGYLFEGDVQSVNADCREMTDVFWNGM